MVEYTLRLNFIFGALADPTRRDILRRVGKKPLSVSAIAKAYDLSLATVSKHLQVLEKARLVLKRRDGKQRIVQLAPVAMKDASEYLRRYEANWNQRLDSLERYLKTTE